VCHVFVKAGEIQYLSDCTHELAGKTVQSSKACGFTASAHGFI
jgi:hypothetical protein